MPMILNLITTNVPMNVGRQKHSNANPSMTEYAGFQLMKPSPLFGQTD
jgi:hypothetical protein